MKTVRALPAVAAAALLLAGCEYPDVPASPPLNPPATSSAGLRVVPARVTVPGYDPDCTKGHACVFGPAWSDDHPGLGGHNGCDTRNDILAAQGRDVVRRNCVVQSMLLADPYTGQTIEYRAGQKPNPIQIDHLYPRARAWDMGASTWTPQKRQQFANDQRRNLLAVASAANNAKRDKGLDQWLPDNRGYRTQYVCQYAAVAAAYDLAVTTAEAKIINTLCPNGNNR